MFQIGTRDLQAVLADFGVRETVSQWEELLCYTYAKKGPDSKEVRLIGKATFPDREPLVVKFKNEEGVTRQRLEAQSAFSEHLASRGVPTARYHRWAEGYVMPRTVGDREVLVSVEDFRPGEIKVVDPAVAEKTGRLLATTHNIAEADRCHVDAPVLFDPFDRNDLFSFQRFQALGPNFRGEDADRFRRICEAYHARMALLAPLRERERFAVQGDISDCNLFLTPEGDVGMFDFNNCGDAVLFCDAVMQGVFEARLMDYDRPLTEAFSRALFDSFLAGYQSARPLTAEERDMVPHLCAVIEGFSLMDLVYAERSLEKRIQAGDREGASAMLEAIEDRVRL